MEFVTFSESAKKKKKGKTTPPSVGVLPGIFGQAASSVAPSTYEAELGPLRQAKQQKQSGPQKDDDDDESEEEPRTKTSQKKSRSSKSPVVDSDDSDEQDDEFSSEEGENFSDEDDEDDEDDDEAVGSEEDVAGDAALEGLDVNPADFHKPRTLRQPKKKKKSQSQSNDFFGISFANAVATVLGYEIVDRKESVLCLAPQFNRRIKEEQKKEKAKQRTLAERQALRKVGHIVLKKNKAMVWNEREARLRADATTGVVQLFNAIRTSQLERRVLKEEDKTKELDKKTFFELLEPNQPEKTLFQKNAERQQRETEERRRAAQNRDDDDEERADPTATKWNALQEEFGMGSSLKNWDEDDDEGEQEQEEEGDFEFADSEEEED